MFSNTPPRIRAALEYMTFYMWRVKYSETVGPSANETHTMKSATRLLAKYFDGEIEQDDLVKLAILPPLEWSPGLEVKKAPSESRDNDGAAT